MKLHIHAAILLSAAPLLPAPPAMAEPVLPGGWCWRFAPSPMLGLVQSTGGGFGAHWYVTTPVGIVRVFGDLTGGLEGFVGDLDSPRGIAISTGGTFGEYLYFVEYGTAKVRRVTTGAVVTDFATLGDPKSVKLEDLAFAGSAAGFGGDLYVTDHGEPGRILRIGSAGNVSTFYSDSTFAPIGLAFASDGRLVVADAGQLCCDDGGVVAFDAAATPEVLVSADATDLFNPLDVAQGPAGPFGSDLFISDESTDRVYRLDSTGQLTLFGIGFHFGAGFENLEYSDGDLYFDSASRLIATSVTQSSYAIRWTCAGNAVCNYPYVVNIDDLLAVINQWGTCSPTCPADTSPPFSGDGQVNLDDLLAVITGWGACPPSPP